MKHPLLPPDPHCLRCDARVTRNAHLPAPSPFNPDAALCVDCWQWAKNNRAQACRWYAENFQDEK